MVPGPSGCWNGSGTSRYEAQVNNSALGADPLRRGVVVLSSVGSPGVRGAVCYRNQCLHLRSNAGEGDPEIVFLLTTFPVELASASMTVPPDFAIVFDRTSTDDESAERWTPRSNR